MEVGRDISVVSVLSDEEAWQLLREVAGDALENPSLHDIAKEVARECGGVPIAISALGKALAKKDKIAWEDTLLQLKKSTGTYEKVQSCILLCYNFLRSHGPQLQPLLLLCSIFQKDENILIQQLVQYAMGLELFDDVATVEETTNSVYTSINHLKSCNLLLDGDKDENGDVCVKMHEIVRDVCLLIASSSQHSFMVRHESSLKLWPQDIKLKTDHTTISLMSDVMDELPAGLEYPKLRILQLRLKSEHINIPADFFQGMKALRVFSFQGNTEKYGRQKRSFVSMPPSLQFLTNLRALSLDFCRVEGDVSVIGCLKGLEILSFFKSRLDKLPGEVRGLCNLKLLDLRCDKADLEMENSVLCCLGKLEVLYMGNYESWINNMDSGEKNASITELESLSFLTTLQIKVPNSKILLELKKFFFDELKSFEISINWGSYSCGQIGITRNSLRIGEGDLTMLFDTKVHSITRKTQNLELEGCDEGEFIFDAVDLARGVFHNLEILAIEEMANLIAICRDDEIPDGSFHRLQKLRLAMLPAMKHLWKGPIQPPSFVSLGVLDMSDCHSIVSLFSPSAAKCLVQLEELRIGFCFELERVISNEGREGDKGIEKIQFPKLNYLWLDHLPKLDSFYLESGNKNLEDNECDTMLPLFSQWVTLPSLDKMEIQNLNILKQIVGCQLQDGTANKLRVIVVVNCEKLMNFVNSTAMLQNLQEVVIDNCESMETLFDLDGLKAMGELSSFIASKLESIQLIELAKLTHVWKNFSRDIQGFQNLKTLVIYYCHELRYLVSEFMSKILVNLQVLNLSWCNGMVNVIEGDDKDEEEDICGKPELKGRIVFHQLRVLRLESLGSFTSFCSSKHDLEFPLLDNLKIKGCPNMKVFCSGVVKAPMLKEPVDDPDGKQWIWEGNLNNGFYREKRAREEEKEDAEEDGDEASGQGE